ncbi:OprO/OprP family phosphate-selective porin [Kushneria sinocarnis]|uniref:OprO/OprP family phosphate-selective porin n=1 Tax=Kushneria sinocarnis TaxID=595502 RepID=UPI001475CD52|nr:porin [Kushneria sinocarnis]
MPRQARRLLPPLLGLWATLGPGVPALPASADEAGSSVTLTEGALGLKSTDDRFAIRLHGLIQADGAVFDQDRTELGNGTDMRNAKLIVKGHVQHDWGYKFQVNFAKEDNRQLEDIFLQYRGFRPTTITVGNVKQPFSLAFLNGNRNATFMEFAMIHEALVPKRRIGLMAGSHGEHWTARLGGFGNRVQDEDSAGDSGASVVGRGVWTPVRSQRRLVLAGLAGQYRSLGDRHRVAIKSRPGTHVTNQRLVGFGPHTGFAPITDARSVTAGDAQVAVVHGPLAVQGEFVHKRVGRKESHFDARGGYVQASYFLTGESRASAYRPGKGAFGAITPIHPYGAWQVALRYDTLALNDDGMQGGHAQNLTAGVNWYANRHVRFSANYIRIDAARPGGPDNRANAFAARAQLGF